MELEGENFPRIRAIQIDNLRGLLGIRRLDSPKFTDKEVLQ